MAVDGNMLRPVRTTTTLGHGKSPTLGAGSVSQSFFSKGDEQEADGYAHVVEATPLTAPRLEFESFDKIPRRRRPLVIIAGLASVMAIGVMVWKSTRGLGGLGATVRTATLPAGTAQPASATTISAAATPSATVDPTLLAKPALAVDPVAPAAPAQGSNPTAPAMNAATTATANPVATDVPTVRAPASAAAPTPPATRPETAAATQAVSPAPPSREEARPARRSTTTDNSTATGEPADKAAASHKRHGGPLRGYVWSPEANALVPARATPDTTEPSSVTTEPSSVAAPVPSPALPERSIAPDEGRRPLPGETTTPAPFDPKTPKTPTTPTTGAGERAPILE